MRCSIINYRAQLVSMDTGNNATPVAKFTSSANNLVVAFTDTSTDSDGTIASHAWTFGDGGTSTTKNPSHTYATAGTYTVTLKVTDNAGAVATKSASVTVTSGGGGGGGSGTALASGVAVGGLAAAKGAQLAFYIDVPAGASSLTIRSSGGTGDADLYIKRGAAPTTTSFDYRRYLTGNTETVAIQNHTAARYHVVLRGYAAFSGVSLVATVVSSSGGFADTKPNLSAASSASKQFSFEVPAGATNLTVAIAGGTGGADLYVKRGSTPTLTSYDHRPFLQGNAETVTSRCRRPAPGMSMFARTPRTRASR
ncbi:MAG TPA: pre-peptidase C-terminal domain-containing protein [Kofleriaceae bacterium]|nr:pre-peptidase C-terminal domain-containing protein [Kofleriaceae bacterium]